MKRRTDLACGFLRLDKPAGMSSFQALGPVKRAFRGSKVGHAGTLDPDATGLLIAAVGPATRLLSWIESQHKTYQFRLHLGFATDTGDTSGALIQSSEVPHQALELLRSEIPRFRGIISQVPPAYSAIKINGQRAYALARKGEEVEIPARDVEILQLFERRFGNTEQPVDANGRDFPTNLWIDLELQCSKGTYVRSLGRDLAAAIGCHGCVSKIHRTAIGKQELLGAAHPQGDLEAALQDVTDFLSFPQLLAPEIEIPKLLNGMQRPVLGVEAHQDGDIVFVMSPQGQPLLLGEVLNGRVQPKVVLG
jgi:tRNA pseudouridine55 synthase